MNYIIRLIFLILATIFSNILLSQNSNSFNFNYEGYISKRNPEIEPERINIIDINIKYQLEKINGKELIVFYEMDKNRGDTKFEPTHTQTRDTGIKDVTFQGQDCKVVIVDGFESKYEITICENLMIQRNLTYKTTKKYLWVNEPWSHFRYVASEYFSKSNHLMAYETIKKATDNSENIESWYSLSWYALFVKPQEAIEAAIKTLELDPKRKSVLANKALGHVCMDEIEKAMAIYSEWKNLVFMDYESKTAREIFIEDIRFMQKQDLDRDSFSEILRFLKRQ